MRNCPWYLVPLLASGLSTAGCSEGDAIFDAVSAHEVLTVTRDRFKILDDLVKRGLTFKEVEGGFMPVDPVEDSSTSRVKPMPAPGGVWRKPGNHHLKAEFPAKAGGVMRLSNGPVTIEVRPVGAQDTAGVVAGRALVYRGAYPGADSIHVAEKERVEEFILLRDGHAPSRFEYEVKVLRGGGEVRQMAGVVEVLDRAGRAWLRLGRAWVEDGRGDRHDVSIRYQDERLEFSIPGRARIYPLLLDPGWTTTGSLAKARSTHSATLLKDGKVLVAGGNDGVTAISGAEVYNPAAGTWTTTKDMSKARHGHTATLLGNGKVLVTGGFRANTRLSSAELYDPVAGTWTNIKVMAKPRSGHTATLLGSGKVLIAGGALGDTSAELYDPVAGTWTTTTGSMTKVRGSHTATLLGNGKVLVVTGGGTKDTSAELYDPLAGTWSATGSMFTARLMHAATLLPNGKVLVAGGYGTSSASSAELYDPGSGTWTATGGLTTGRKWYHTLVPLGSGKVLLTAGYGTNNSPLSSSELYDPVAGTWSAARSTVEARANHKATLLDDGRVLISGGTNKTVIASVELYDPAAGTWGATKAMSKARWFHTATLMGNGKVLVAGGSTLSSAELYDPASGTWSAAGSMASVRSFHTATLLGSGKVLVAGGRDGLIPLSSAELYDPVAQKWATTGSLSKVRWGHTATLMGNGKVLVTGGRGAGGSASVTSSAELYDPVAGTWASAGAMAQARYSHTATMLGNGKVLVAGGSYSGALSSAELFDPMAGTWAKTGAMAQGRHGHTATMLGNGKVLVAGGIYSGALSGAELYDPVAGTWSATGSMAKARWHHATTLLGVVLVMGGYEGGATAELFDPQSGVWIPARSMAYARTDHTSTLLTTGKVLVAGGKGPGGATAELYDLRDLIACRYASDCPTGFCTDGYCCTTACSSTCKQCVVQVSVKRPVGLCVNVAAGKQDKNAKVPCVGNNVCDGNGACKKVNGQTCTTDTECATGHCADGVCCDTACTETCKTCDLASHKGKCTDVLAGQQDLNAKTNCTSPKACDGKGACKTAKGYTCTTDSDCASGHCADGVCCDFACDGMCLSCNLSGKVGTCSIIPAGQPDSSGKTTCSGAQVCDGKGACKTAKGQTCTKGDACLTGFCVDYKCCDTACTGTCMSCAVVGALGTCSFTPVGQQDGNASTACSSPKACDGKGGCRDEKGATCTAKASCASGFCADGHCCDTECLDTCRACNIATKVGTCSVLAAGKQDLYAKATCKWDNVCDGAGACGKANGVTCAKGADCAGGNCADGVCCDSKCDTLCYACSPAAFGTGKAGVCSPIKANKPDLNADTKCTGTNVCNGKGNCGTANGQKCTADKECGSGFCTDGYCCNTRCDTACKACDVKGKEGSCSNSTAHLPDLNAKTPCTGKMVCDGFGDCKKDVSELCSSASECATGFCADNVCCLTSCMGNCASCGLKGTEGKCKPHPKGTDPDNDCMGKDKKCGGKCDGAGKCDYPTVGTGCGTGPCKACDGTGTCNKAPLDDSACGTIDCDELDTRCRDYSDLTGDRCESFGKCKKANDTKTCINYTDLKCGDAGPDLGAGKVDLSGARDAEAGPGPGGEESGCNCRAAGPDRVPAGLLVLLALLWRFTTKRKQA